MEDIDVLRKKAQAVLDAFATFQLGEVVRRVELANDETMLICRHCAKTQQISSASAFMIREVALNDLIEHADTCPYAALLRATQDLAELLTPPGAAQHVVPKNQE